MTCTLIQALFFRLKSTKNKQKLVEDLMENMIIGQIEIYHKEN